MERVKIGVIGCGVISDIYLKNLTQMFVNTQVVAVTDWVREKAEQRAKEYGIPTVCGTSQELLAMEEIELVVILTVPDQHANLCADALRAGKHVYMEKPLALCRKDALQLMDLAKQHGRFLATAPDTLLATNLQTARKLVTDGWIGDAVGAVAIRINAGPESWHPNPAFLYQKGAGPLLDVGPDYVAGLAYLLGPVQSVQCSARITSPRRTITSQPLFGQTIQVEEPTLVSGILNFANGAIATTVLSWDVQGSRRPAHDIEVYGTLGTIGIPSFGSFEGTLQYKPRDSEAWDDVAPLFPYTTDSRGVGVADMAAAIRHGRTPRLSAEMTYHTFDVLDSMLDTWQQKRELEIGSTFTPTPLFPLGMHTGEVQ